MIPAVREKFERYVPVEMARSMKVSAVALAITSVVFIALGASCMGIGMSRRFMNIGMGLIPYMGGVLSVAVATGLIIAATPLAILGQCRLQLAAQQPADS
ncbi:MAG: hypothetical protein S4CHLAM81_08700 [Chlamydiales bacterium]|nr:hypothetical protein [Chlamydiales bacterium]MCH9635650.1 hypothetical protein [Chlamydiales bacterium]MCH9704054.1 hypothetical protein [Chlamydiota bacterium]